MDALKSERGIDAGEIGFVAFTRAAAKEAKDRLGITKSKTIRTLHSFTFEAGEVSRDRMVDAFKLREFGEIIGYECNGDAQASSEIGSEYLELHHYARARKISVEDAHKVTHSILDADVAALVSRAYTDWKTSYGWKDFDDLLVDFARNPNTFGINYLFVDEAQDLSPIQWDAVNAMDVRTLWVAGDDDQSIYEWSGANPHGMSAFHDEGGTNVRVLDQSWRIPRSVHLLAEEIIGRVSQRWDKNYSPRSEEGSVRGYGDIDYAPTPVPGESTLVLYRNHQFRGNVESWLMSHAIPYDVVGSDWGPFNGPWATALRGARSLKREGECTPPQMRSLERILGDTATSSFWLRYDPIDYLQIPEPIASYLRSVDLSAVPTVRISTIHAAKGTEADRVILLTGQGERTFEDEGDAEHRTFYVGVTRARHKLDVVDGDNPYPISA
jgi:superfamily I DNA/RNA helicase